MEHKFFWKVVYNDDTELYQHNTDGTTNKYTDIDRSKLTKFILFRENKTVIVLNLDENKILI